MDKAFQKFIHQQGLFSSDDHILLAVSGGIDSVVMTDFFHRNGYSFAITHCNFGLRGEESDKDELFVRKLGHKLKVPVFIRKFQTTRYAEMHGLSIQMAARQLRYPWFEEIRKKEDLDYIATAHHLDDQVETFFINLTRGTGISGLHGILPKQGKVIRPLLFASRSEIEAYAIQNNIAYRKDLSNESTKYIRNKIRHELIPVLKEINPEFLTGMTETIQRIREFEMIGESEINARRMDIIRTESKRIMVDIPKLKSLVPVHAYAWEFLSPFNFNQTQVNDILASLDKESGKKFDSPTHRLIKDRQELIIVQKGGQTGKPAPRRKDDSSGSYMQLQENQEICIIEKGIGRANRFLHLKSSVIQISPTFQIPVDKRFASLDYDKVQFPLTLRKWETGDAFYPFGMNRKKKLSDFFIDQKFSLNDKENTWLLCSGSKITWVIGHRIDHRFRITNSTRKVLRIEIIDS